MLDSACKDCSLQFFKFVVLFSRIMFLKSDLFYFVLVAKAYGFCLRARPVNSNHILNVLETVKFVFCLQIHALARPRLPRAVYEIFRSLYIQLVHVFVNKTLTTVSNSYRRPEITLHHCCNIINQLESMKKNTYNKTRGNTSLHKIIMPNNNSRLKCFIYLLKGTVYFWFSKHQRPKMLKTF